MTDIYAEFGVTNAFISTPDQSEHEQEMLKLDVDVRDGDDQINLTQEGEGDNLGATEGQEENTEALTDEDQGDEGKDALELLQEPTDELKQTTQALVEYEAGFDSLRAQAVQNGLTEEAATLAEQEYETDGKLSEKTYEALAKAGYSKTFVDSFIRGQEALATQFVDGVVRSAGGKEAFTAVVEHMKATSPEAVIALEQAMERKDLVAIRSILNLGIQSRSKKFGNAPKRNVTANAPTAPQSRVQASKAEPFASRGEMISAMNSREYRTDDAYRRKVEARVLASPF